jgi:hypothetical protein
MIHSEIDEKYKKKGWFRGGKEIFYFENHLLVCEGQVKNYYTLRFSYKFQHVNDVVSFA